jgi:hypothetical protein
METVVRNWKKFVAGKHGLDWQRDFFDHRLRDHTNCKRRTSYILMTPVRKGLCGRAEDCGVFIVLSSLAVDRIGCSIVYSHRIYGEKVGDQMSKWFKRQRSEMEKTLIAWDNSPSSA